MQIKIGKYDVTLKDSITWGEAQQIQAVLASGAKIGSSGLQGYDPTVMLEAKYKLLEIAITDIADGEQHSAFSRDWMNALSLDEGDTLYDAVDALSKKK
jgi:hypothetical protein